MRTAATLDVTIPETRKLVVELPSDVPTGSAQIVVRVPGVPASTDEPPAAVLGSEDGVPVLRVPAEASVEWSAASVQRVRGERQDKLSGTA